ncbi:MAG: helix-turn-helix transcriptional regulator [bacterium]
MSQRLRAIANNTSLPTAVRLVAAQSLNVEIQGLIASITGSARQLPNDSTPMSFGRRLRQCRLFSGLTQARVAEEIGYSVASISKWESGKIIPSDQICFALRRLFPGL